MLGWVIFAAIVAVILWCWWEVGHAEPCADENCPDCYVLIPPFDTPISRYYDRVRDINASIPVYFQPGEMNNREQSFKDMKKFVEIDFAEVELRVAAELALKEQGASPQYIDKVKAELCGPFGRVMNHG